MKHKHSDGDNAGVAVGHLEEEVVGEPALPVGEGQNDEAHSGDDPSEPREKPDSDAVVNKIIKVLENEPTRFVIRGPQRLFGFVVQITPGENRRDVRKEVHKRRQHDQDKFKDVVRQ